MVTVVIDHKHAVLLTLDLKSALSATNPVERRGDVFKLDSKIKTNRNSCQRIMNIVLSRHSQIQFTQFFSENPSPELRRETCIQMNPHRRHVGLGRRTITDRPASQLWDDRLHVLIVKTKNNRPVERNTVSKTHKALLDLLDAPSEVIEVIGVDVCQNRDRWSQQQ